MKGGASLVGEAMKRWGAKFDALKSETDACLECQISIGSKWNGIGCESGNVWRMCTCPKHIKLWKRMMTEKIE